MRSRVRKERGKIQYENANADLAMGVPFWLTWSWCVGAKDRVRFLRGFPLLHKDGLPLHPPTSFVSSMELPEEAGTGRAGRADWWAGLPQYSTLL